MATIKNRLAALEGIGGGDSTEPVTAIRFSLYDSNKKSEGLRRADGYRINLRSSEVERIERQPDESRDDFEARASAALNRYCEPGGVPPIMWPIFDKPQLLNRKPPI